MASISTDANSFRKDGAMPVGGRIPRDTHTTDLDTMVIDNLLMKTQFITDLWRKMERISGLLEPHMEPKAGRDRQVRRLSGWTLDMSR